MIQWFNCIVWQCTDVSTFDVFKRVVSFYCNIWRSMPLSRVSATDSYNSSNLPKLLIVPYEHVLIWKIELQLKLIITNLSPGPATYVSFNNSRHERIFGFVTHVQTDPKHDWFNFKRIEQVCVQTSLAYHSNCNAPDREAVWSSFMWISLNNTPL